ncbi:MAG: hypothetical protein SFT94_10290 [Pseudanabaenaceae cyanobacterium bins.68]|nr:hypothetical protein [Pseudanabaenaceae cyanobacterium bins.68]
MTDHLESPTTPGNIVVSRPENLGQLSQEIDLLEEMILESTPRFMGRNWVDEDKICQQIDKVRLAMPASISEAQALLQSRLNILSAAEHHADELVQTAQRRAQMLLEDSLLIRQAEQEANQIRRRVQEECDLARREAMDEVNHMRRQAQKELDLNYQRVKEDAETLKAEADQYCEQSLVTLETQLIDMLKIVQNGRRELRKSGGAI